MSGFIKLANQWFASTLLSLSALCLVALMFLTVAEVIGRYVFNAPIFGRQDIAQILLACSIFFAFPVVTLRGQQIAVDLLDSVFTPSAAFWRDRLIDMLVAISLVTMSVWLFHRAEKALSRGLTSEMLFLPKYPLLTFVAVVVGATGALLALRATWLLLTNSTRETS